MADFRGYVTAAGQTFEALAKQMGYPVTIGFIEVGDGKLPDSESPIDRTQLVHKLKQFPAIVEQDAKNPGQWVATCYIPADDAIDGAGYFIREIGCKLINQGNGVLYAYRRVSDDWKPVITSGEAKSFIYKLRFIPSNGELLTPTIDPSVVLVDKEELNRTILKLINDLSNGTGSKQVGYNPYSQGSITISQYDINSTHVNAVSFTSLQSAVNYAASTGKRLVVDGNWTVPSLRISRFNHDIPWHIEFNGQITVENRLDFIGMNACHIKGGVFICPEIYLQGIRYSSFDKTELRGRIHIGKWDSSPTGGSWSLYWNKFNNVQFDAIFVKTTISSCSVNSNTFTNCIFRDNVAAGQLWNVDVAAGQTDPAMTGNTFIGCDWSYSPAWNFAFNYGYAFSATVIGGYLDTATPWYKSGSFLHMTFDVLGLRNPSGANLDSRPSSNIKMTSGGGKPQKTLPVSAISLVKNPPKSVRGPATFYLDPIPYNGDYTLNIILNEQVGVTNYGVGTVRNDTSGAQYSFATSPGITSVSFPASAGDSVRVTWGIATGQPELSIEEFSVTSGAGVYKAVKRAVAEPYEYDSGNIIVTTTPTVALTITPTPYTFTSRDVLITTIDPDGGLAGGGERIKCSLVTSSGGSSSAATIKEYSRVLVNGPGGTSDDPSPVIVALSESGAGINIVLSVASGTVNARIRATYDDDRL